MQLFINQVINGLGQGVVFASVALALVLIFRTTGVLNFAQGEMALFSAFVSWKLTTTGMPVVLAILLSMAVSFAAGAVIERTLIRPMEGRSPLNVVIITLGLFLGLNALVHLSLDLRLCLPELRGDGCVGEVRIQTDARVLDTQLGHSRVQRPDALERQLGGYAVPLAVLASLLAAAAVYIGYQCRGRLEPRD